MAEISWPTLSTSSLNNNLADMNTSATKVGWSPSTNTVDSNQTVQGQVNGLMSSGNPYVEQARTGAKQQMNSRGLLNSSMAIGASDQAAYNAALPIAQADAARYSTVNDQNWNAQNTSQQYNTGVAMDIAKTGYAGEQQTAMGQLDADTKKYLMDTEADYKSLMQTNDSAAKLYDSIFTSIAAVQIDPNLDAAGKTAAINNLKTMLSDGLEIQGAISGLNLSDLLS